jgi:uncharacterized membrane protein
MKNLHKIILWTLVILPTIYLLIKWQSFGDEVPLHWNLKGEVDRYGSPKELWLVAIIPIFTYFIFWLIPKIDPKNKIKEMGKKYDQLKFFIVGMTALLSLYLLYAIQKGRMVNPEMIFFFVGLVFIILGNYLPSIRPNYFVGIRTPWTLENNEVWKDTHRLGGKIFVLLGLVTILLSLALDIQQFFWIYFALIIISVGYLFYYSYVKFQEYK